jgi:hypothetical protein
VSTAPETPAAALFDPDAETTMLLDNLADAISKICKPGRQIRGVVLVMIDESGVPAQLVNAQGRYIHIALGALTEIQYTLVSHL